jgi:hypothetical protein
LCLRLAAPQASAAFAQIRADLVVVNRSEELPQRDFHDGAFAHATPARYILEMIADLA